MLLLGRSAWNTVGETEMPSLTTKIQYSDESHHYSTTIPYNVASMLGVEKGDEVTWELNEDGVLVGRVD